MSEDAIVKMPIIQGAQGCDRVVYQKATVCTLVTITPTATCDVSTACCIGDPVIGTGVCAGDTSFSFTLSQQLCLAIPVTFNADATCGEFTISQDEPPSLTSCEGECTA